MASRTFLTVLLLTVGVGCAQLKAIFAPAPSRVPTPPPSVQPDRKEPRPLLSPHVPEEQEEQMVDEANKKIEGAERGLHAIDTRKLAADQHETYQTISSFLSQAKAALSLKDFPRALNLAHKAQVLTDELSRALR
jgi:hypothetical protein